MERERILDLLHQNQEEILAFGVKRLAIFGSVARGDDHPGSDVDILVEFDRPVGLFSLISLQLRLEKLLGIPVDIGTVECLKPSIRKNVLEECIYVP